MNSKSIDNETVYLTGVAEILLGLALLFPAMRYLTGILLIVLFIGMQPANINSGSAFRYNSFS